MSLSKSSTTKISLPHPYVTTKDSFISIYQPFYLVHHAINNVNNREFYTIQLTNSKDEIHIKTLFLNCLFNQTVGINCELHHYDEWTAVVFPECIANGEEEWIPLSNIHFKSNIESGLFISQQLCEMIQTMHSKNIIHLDLQIENLFLVRKRQSNDEDIESPDDVFFRILGFTNAQRLSARVPFSSISLDQTLPPSEDIFSKEDSSTVGFLSSHLQKFKESDASSKVNFNPNPIASSMASERDASSKQESMSTVNMPLTKNSRKNIMQSRITSPEQITNANLDQRTDIYYLGCVLYFIFTGTTPFPNCKSQSDFVKHIRNQSPFPSPYDINPKVPKFLSDVILKCLQLKPENRYRNVLSLKHDLQRCLALLIHGSNSLKDSSMSCSDILASVTFSLGNITKGREAERSALVHSLQVAQESSQARLVLISGISGIGKTYFVDSLFTKECKSSFEDVQYFFAYGAFPIASVYPYHGFKECLTSIAFSIRNMDSEAIEKFNTILETHVLELNHLNSLLYFCPALEAIITPVEGTPSTVYLGVDEFSSAIEAFLFSYHELTQSSIVLMLDNLQFCDNNSLIIIRNLLSRANFPCLIICVHESVDEEHTLYYFPNILQEDYTTASRSSFLEFAPFESIQLQSLVMETLQLDMNDDCPPSVVALTNKLLEASQGSLLVFTELLIQLHRESLISFNHSQLKWDFDIDEISRSRVMRDRFDHPIGFYFNILSRLDDSTQSILKHAACFGNTFRLSFLASFLQVGQYNVEQMLHSSIELGWIRKVTGDYFTFSHNSIQQAAYSLMSPNEAELLHTQLGIHLLNIHKTKNSVFEDLDSAIPVLLQLNASPHRLQGSQVQEIILLNQKAAQNCLQIAAITNALHYATIANSLLPQDPWNICYELTVSVFYTLADILMEQRSYEQAQFLFQTLLQHSKSTNERLRATSKLLRCQSKNMDYQAGSLVFVSLLQEFPEKTFNLPIPKEIAQQSENNFIANDSKDEGLTLWIENRLANLSPQVEAFETPNEIIKKMIDLGRECKDDSIRYFVDCLVEGYPHVVFTHQESLYISAVLILGEYIFVHGLTSTSCSAALCSFAVIYSLLTKDYTSAFIIAKAGLEIARMPLYFDQNYLTVCLYYYGSIAHAHWDVNHCLEIYDEGFAKGQLCGDAWSGYNCFFKFVTMCLTGQNMSDVVNFEVEAIEFFSNTNSLFVCDSLRSVAEIVHSLTDISGSLKFSPKYEVQNFEEMKFGRYCHSLCNAIFCYFAENYEDAYRFMQKFVLYEDDSSGGFFEFIHPLFCVLIIAKVFGSGLKKPKEFLITMNSCRKYYEGLISQTRCFHKASYFLTCAEYTRCRAPTDFLQIVDAYQNAITHAHDVGFYLIEAIASTRLLEYYHECHQPERVVSVLADEAVHVWESMNATAMAHRISSRYLSEYISLQGTQTSSARRKWETENGTQALLTSGSDRAMNVLAESVTNIVKDQKADRGCFFSIGANNEVVLVSESGVDGGVAFTDQLTSTSVCLPVIEESLKSGKPVIINNANELFKDDSYIRENNITRIMCTPVSIHGKPSGLYYLEMTSEDAPEFSSDDSKKVGLMAKSAVFDSIQADHELISKFVPIDFLKLLGPNAISEGVIKSTQKELTVIYANIRNFTELTRMMTSEESFLFLKEFMNVLGPQVKKNGGIIDRFVGDNIMLVFPQSVDSALLSAFSMIRILRSLNERLAKKKIGHELQIGIGIHHGTIQLGVVEFGNSLYTSVVSPMVQTCSNLARLSESLEVPILMTRQAFDGISKSTVENKVVRRIGKFIFEGQGNFELFEIYSKNWRGHRNLDNELLQKAIYLFSEQKFDEAITVLKNMTLDHLVRFYGKACIAYKRTTLPEVWKGEISVDGSGQLSNTRLGEQIQTPRSFRKGQSRDSTQITMEDFQTLKHKIVQLEQKVAKQDKSQRRGILSLLRRNRKIHVDP